MASSPFNLGPLPGAYSGLRRSVIDPVTGKPVITSAPTGEVVQRSSVLPIGLDDSGALTLAVPGMLMGMVDAARYPGQVYRGEKQVFDPETNHVSDEAIGKAFDLADAAMLGPIPMQSMGAAFRPASQVPAALRQTPPSMAAPEIQSLASRAPSMYDPWARTARPFEADYPAKRWPDGPPSDASGRLTRDIEGRAINPDARVAGRQSMGGPDRSIPGSELDAVSASVLGEGYQVVPKQALPRNSVGAYTRSSAPDGIERRILVSDTLPPLMRDKVGAHEFGHGVDDITGDFIGSTGPQPFAIPQKGISKELNDIYNELNNADFRAALDRTGDIPSALARAAKNRGLKPQHQGYSDKEASAELIAEAVRFYAADPNAMKTLAPKTAALIRARVNGNPTLSPHIQFNSMAGLAAAGGGAATLYGFAPPAEAGDANERGSLPPFNLGPLLRKGF